MTAITMERPRIRRATSRFLKTPKGYLLLWFGALGPLALWTAGSPGVAVLLYATVAAAATDLALMYAARSEWAFPSGAILTGMILAFVMSPYTPLRVVVMTAVGAIVAKRLIRVRTANVFNPAALALVGAALFFQGGQSWWGALPDLGLSGAALVVVLGILVARYVNKLPLVLTFLAAYLFLFTIASFAGDPARVAEIFRTPDIHAALFFAFFMLDDPPTCPVRYGDQVAFALIASAGAYFCYMVLGRDYYLLAGLLLANGWEAIRRVRQARARSRPALAR